MPHTPTPWTMEIDPNAIVIEDLSENTVCEFTINTADDIAFYADVESDVRPILPEEALSNARLFMAAPELLSALKDLAADTELVARNSYSVEDDDFPRCFEEACPRLCAMWTAAIKAIAKAEGVA